MTCSHRIFVSLVALIAISTATTASAQDCSAFDPACRNTVFAANVSTPICPDNSTLDASKATCYLPCSFHNSGNITYTPHEEDSSTCVPSCLLNSIPKPGADYYSTRCIICPVGAPVVQSKRGEWVCRRGSQTTMPIKTITREYKERQEIEGGCPEGSSYVNGVCASCSSPDTYLTDVTSPDSTRQYMFWQAQGATFCVPDECCIANSWLVEGGKCEEGDCVENPE